MPDQGQDWGRCKFAQAAFDFFAGWGRTAGGFIVPRGHDKFSGVSFKKELIIEVLNIKSSSTSEINKLFAPEGLEKAPKAKAWVTSTLRSKVIVLFIIETRFLSSRNFIKIVAVFISFLKSF
ncbi:hypothetical protein B0H14DRAFT_2642028 [Mycena olivaceomarginata]|nr:hypothetical protein B0H14DRAFT_2642028 [Mycena olivaceomarginata]